MAEFVLTVEQLPQACFGEMPIFNYHEGVVEREFVPLWEINESHVDKKIWVRAYVQSKRSRFLVLRQKMETAQAVLDAAFCEGDVPGDACVRWVQSVPNESILDLLVTVVGGVNVRTCSIKQYELRVNRALLVSRAAPAPFAMADAQRPEIHHNEENEGVGAVDGPRVAFDTRLNYRYFDLRTPANQALVRLSARVCGLYREYLEQHDFVEIHTPKISPGASEGGSEVFHLDYFRRDACLAQSPQLYKQMAITAGMERVYEIGPVFRAENSQTNRHLTEFVMLDLEQTINCHYHEVLQTLTGMFVHIFEGLTRECQREIEAVRAQFPFTPLRWLPAEQTPIITYTKACELLEEAGVHQDPNADMSSVSETTLGEIVAQKYGTDFFVLDQFPMTARPFYTMPHAEIPGASNSYDLFIRGREVTSGAQRIHEVNMLIENAQKKGVPPESLGAYVDSFRYGCPPHGGAGIGMERVVSLFLDLGSVKRVSLFPRDPQRIAP